MRLGTSRKVKDEDGMRIREDEHVIARLAASGAAMQISE